MGLWALGLALFAVAIAAATGIIVWNWLVQLKKTQQAFEDDLKKKVSDALDDLAAKRKETDVEICKLRERLIKVEMSRDEPEESTLPAVVDERMAEGLEPLMERLTQMRQWADTHFIAAAGDAARATVLQEELGRYITSTLDQQAASAGSDVLACALYASQPSALDILPPLAEELWSALGAELMYRQADGPGSRRCYVRWPQDQQETRLRGLAYSAVTEGETGHAGPEITALQAILRAAYDSGPVLLQLGPLLISRTSTSMSYGFIRAGRLTLSAEQLEAAVSGSRPDLLRWVGAYGIINLTGWSARHAAA